MRHDQRLKCLFFISLTILSCRNSTNPVKNEVTYFNLTDYIENESKRLSAQSRVNKTVFLNGREESKFMPVSSWDNELSAFKDADISKKSMLGKYEVDSIEQGNALLIKYSTIQEKFRTKELTVLYDENNRPVRINAIVATNNALYSSRQNLLYEPEYGYSISGSQNIRFLEPDSFSIKARFDKF